MLIQKIAQLLIVIMLAGCATGRDMTSSHFIPQWENKIINLPTPSETTGGYWAIKAAKATGKVIERIIVFPFALVGNIAVNAYYIPTWPLRWMFRGDKRLIVWYPLFDVGEEVGSEYYSKEWNKDLV